MKSRGSNVSIESIMVMILMIGFAVSISLMITQGSQLFKESIEDKEDDENIRIAMSYINMRVKQNDVAGKVYLLEKAVEGIDALVIEHQEEELGFKSFVYYNDGYLVECYTDEIPTKEMSTSIIPSDLIEFELIPKNNQLIIHYESDNDMLKLEQIITLRSK